MQPIGKKAVIKPSYYVESDLMLYFSEMRLSRKDEARIITIAEKEIEEKFGNRVFFDKNYIITEPTNRTVQIADREIKKINDRRANNKKVIKKMLLFILAFVVYLYIGSKQSVVSVFGYASLFIGFPVFFIIIFDKEEWYNIFFKFVTLLNMRVALCILILIVALVLI